MGSNAFCFLTGSSWGSMVIRGSVFRQLLLDAVLFLSQLLCQCESGNLLVFSPGMMKCTIFCCSPLKPEKTSELIFVDRGAQE